MPSASKTKTTAPEWPADHVERRPTDSLVNYARNSRTHTVEQIEKIAASMREWGWTSPILVAEDGTIIAGHARVMAARKLGLAEVPVMVARGWTEAQRRAYVIADNQLTVSGAGWDDELLRIELGELQGLGFDLGLTGFDATELAGLMIDPTDADGEGGEGGGGSGSGGAGSLAEKFGVPPFTVLNAREGWWQERKRAWIALGIKSELGRGAAPGGAPMPLDRAGGGKRHPGRVDDAGR